jgi:CRISPR-associated protein Cmr1
MSRKPLPNPNPEKPWPPDVKKQSGLRERTVRTSAGETRIVVQTREYKLITPLFGGGIEPGANDLDNLIRGPEIRGQLRFWWRAIRGGQPEFEGKLEKMKAREDEIWGTASNTSNQREVDELKKEQEKQAWNGSVQIEVEVPKDGQGQPIKPFKLVLKNGKYKISSDNGIPGYAAFPLRPPEEEVKRMGQDTPLAELRQNVEFSLRITFPEKWTDDVLASLWAWETFGGVGARTRRGFGALLLEKIDGKSVEDENLPPADSQRAEAWLKTQLLAYKNTNGETFPANVPHLEATINSRVPGPFLHPQDAWNELIGRLYRFRQKRVDSRGYPSLFGKSLWPEANALRRRLHPDWKQIRTPDKFPRAAFGLPLVFHLAHEHPAQTITLQNLEDGSERWASRLILKPIPCQEKQFLGLAMVLDGSELPEETLALTRDGGTWQTISKEQTQINPGELPELNQILGKETDILRAFLKFLSNGGN